MHPTLSDGYNLAGPGSLVRPHRCHFCRARSSRFIISLTLPTFRVIPPLPESPSFELHYSIFNYGLEKKPHINQNITLLKNNTHIRLLAENYDTYFFFIIRRGYRDPCVERVPRGYRDLIIRKVRRKRTNLQKL